MFKQPPVSSLVQSCTQTLDPPHFRGQLGSDSTDLNQRPGLHKASKPSRVLSDFTSQKSFEDLIAPPRKLKSPPIQPITSHRRTHTLSTLSETKESHPISIVSAIDAIVMPTSKVKIPKISIGTSPTPRIKPVSFESTPGSMCRSAIIRRQDNLIFIQSGDDAKEDQASYSPSDTSILKLPRPKTTPNFPTRESTSEAMRQHFVEVRRVRKMTQLLGRELPPELVQVVDNQCERSRGRPDSTASSTSECVSSIESYTDVSEGENTSSLTRPETDFQERRRRITKLSQFFGVRHADLASVVTKPKHHRTTSSIFSQKSVSFDEPTRVGIKMVSRKRFGSGEDMREVELGDAIDKLRCLKVN